MVIKMIRIKGLVKTFGAKKVLSGVDLHIRKGETYVMLGPSGCGKTTLLSCIKGLIPYDSGRINVKGDAAIMFQEPRLIPWKNCMENVQLGLTLQGRHDDGYVDELLEDMGLRPSKKLYPRQLSGGMCRRTALARTLAVKPDILLLDEPFTNLDPKTKRKIEDLVGFIKERYGLTIILVTHSIEESLRFGDNIALMSGKNGKIRSTYKKHAANLKDMLISEIKKD